MRIYTKTIVKYLNDHIGEEMNTWELLKGIYGDRIINDLDIPEKLRIDERVRKIAENAGIYLDSTKYEDMLVGLPFIVPFVIKKVPFVKKKEDKR